MPSGFSKAREVDLFCLPCQAVPVYALMFPYNSVMDSTTYTTDTTQEALEVQLECFRRMTPQERIAKMSSWSSQIKRMGFEAIRRRHPEYDDFQVQSKFIELTYGEQLAEGFRSCLEGKSVEPRR
jgi:hypothetical protein